MPVFHRSQRLQIYGGRVEVSQLFNSRYEIVVRCTANKDTEAWYNDNKAQIFADFGTLYSAQMSIEGIDSRTGEAYPNMVLVQNEAGYTRTGDYVVTFTYETLTTSFVEETQEKVDFELEGLRRVTRNLIAKSGSTYGKTVGSTTISHTAHGYGSATLTLAAVQEDVLSANEGGFVRLQETWVEAGILSEVKSNLKDGVIQVATTFLAVEGTTVGPVIRRTKENFSGLQTISVTTLQNKNGQSVLQGGSSTPITQHHNLDPFTYPGVVNLIQKIIPARASATNDDITSFEFYLTPPTQALIETETFVFMQTNDTVLATDKTFDGAASLYNPTVWASTYCSGVDRNKNPFSKTDALRGYRALIDLDVEVTEPSTDYTGNFLINGRPILNSCSANIGMRGGPADPEGVRHAFDIQIVPAFEDVDGNVGFKKRITVATIPSRGIDYLPSVDVTQLGSTLSRTVGRFSSGSGIGTVTDPNTSAPKLQLDLNKAPTSVSDGNALIHNTLAVTMGGGITNKDVKVITAYDPDTGIATLSSALTNHSNYTTTSQNFYTLYAINRTGKITQRISQTEYILDNSKLVIPLIASYDDIFNSITLFITAGTGSGTQATITDYDAGTRVFTVSAFTNTSDGSSATPTLGRTSEYRIGPA